MRLDFASRVQRSVLVCKIRLPVSKNLAPHSSKGWAGWAVGPHGWTVCESQEARISKRHLPTDPATCPSKPHPSLPAHVISLFRFVLWSGTPKPGPNRSKAEFSFSRGDIRRDLFAFSVVFTPFQFVGPSIVGGTFKSLGCSDVAAGGWPWHPSFLVDCLESSLDQSWPCAERGSSGLLSGYS